MTREFVRTFQTNLFIDDDFYALQSCLRILKLLLTYHEPQIANYLDSNHVIPEMFCIPWFITYFASRMESAALVLEFWEHIVAGSKDSPDVTFIFFFSVALIVYNKEAIFRSDSADLPQKMTQLSVHSREELLMLLKLAEEIEENTPYSFKQLDELKSLFVRQRPETLKQICSNLESLSCMPLMAAELFFYSFPGEIECPNPDCINSLTWRQDRSAEYFPLAAQTQYALSQVQEGKEANNNDEKESMSQPLSDCDDRGCGHSGMSSFAGSNNSLVHPAAALKSHKSNQHRNTAGHPLETESNLNYEQDH